MAYYEEPRLRERTWEVDLWYPRQEGRAPDAVTVGLMDVRSADNITIRYDFDRDGWVITQDQVREREGGGSMEVVEPDVEVAFLPAWLEDESAKPTHTNKGVARRLRHLAEDLDDAVIPGAGDYLRDCAAELDELRAEVARAARIAHRAGLHEVARQLADHDDED